MTTAKQTRGTIDSLVRISKTAGRDRRGTLASDDHQATGNARAIGAHGFTAGDAIAALNVSGGLVADGPQWQEALARVRRRESRGVAVAYIDRLSRNVRGGLAWVDELAAAGGVLISGGRIIDVTNPHERSGLITELNLAELQLNVYKEKSRETMRMVQRRGIVNRVPYGYMRIGGPHDLEAGIDSKRLTPDPTTAPIVRGIFELRADGARWPAVQRRLEAAGVASPTGQPLWAFATLSTIVRNRCYIGEVKMGDHVTFDAHEPIVTRDVFERAQPRSGVVRTGRNRVGIAGGLISCATCGRPLSVSGRGTGKPTFYACRRTYSGGRCARPVSGDQRSIDTAVDEALREQAERGLDVEAVRVQRELSDAREQLTRAEWDRDQFLEGTAGLPATAIAKGAKLRQDAVDAAAGRVAAAEATATGVAGFPTSRAEWDALSLERQREAARRIVASIVLDPFPKGAPKKNSVAGERVTITWR